MLTQDLLSDIVVALKPSDSGSLALRLMDEQRVFHLPLVKHKKFLGLVSETAINSMGDLSQSIGESKIALIRHYVLYTQHFYDVIRIMATEQLSLIPVLDQKDHYLGCITIGRLAGLMADISSVKQPGGIIVLEVDNQSYSLSEIARIVESNDAKVLSAYITSFPESNRLEVTIKVNVLDISSVIQTFNRYNYIVTASFSEDSKIDDLLESRYESLMNYLNI